MGMLKEFKDFAIKGNMIDMAVGIILGGAFGKVISSLVGDMIMPMLAPLMGNKGISEQFMALDGKDYESLAAAKLAGAPVLGWGIFLQTALDFVIIAFAIFLVIKAINAAKKKEEAKPAATPEDITLLREIRDSLAKK